MTSIWTWSWERSRSLSWLSSSTKHTQVEETVTVIEIDEETYEEVRRTMSMVVIVLIILLWDKFKSDHHDCLRCTNQPRETSRCCLCAEMESSWFHLPCALLARKAFPQFLMTQSQHLVLSSFLCKVSSEMVKLEGRSSWHFQGFLSPLSLAFKS